MSQKNGQASFVGFVKRVRGFALPALHSILANAVITSYSSIDEN